MTKRADVLQLFHPAVAEWFRGSFGAPTPPQREGWPAIARGESTLILAPTGSGKTLTAFLWAINRVMFSPSPVKKAGARVRPKQTFKGLAQSNQSDFIAMSGTLENAGVAAFLMAMPAISDKKYVAAAESIVTIEARHAGFVNALLAKPLSENGAFDKPTSHAEIVNAVSPFIESLNGGPDPADALDNDTVILNFALLLEHLEAEFYRINVPNLFKE